MDGLYNKILSSLDVDERCELHDILSVLIPLLKYNVEIAENYKSFKLSDYVTAYDYISNQYDHIQYVLSKLECLKDKTRVV